MTAPAWCGAVLAMLSLLVYLWAESGRVIEAAEAELDAHDDDLMGLADTLHDPACDCGEPSDQLKARIREQILAAWRERDLADCEAIAALPLYQGGQR